MKKIAIVALLFLCISSVLFSVDKESFDGAVDFSITLERLSSLLSRGGAAALPQDRIIVLNGAISSLQVVRSGEEEGEFLAELELVDGEWIGMQEVEMYSCIVRLPGEEFKNRVPERRSRRRIVNEITLNSEVMVVCKVVGTRTLYTGNVVPVVEALYVRRLG